MHELDVAISFQVASESPTATFIKFTESGIKNLGSPSLQLDHLLSTFRETHRLKDEYTYFYDEGGLYWLTKDSEPKKIYIQDITSRPTNTRTKEGYALDQLEMFAKYANEGFAVWFSPDNKQSGGYPCSKIIFHKISYEVSEKFDKPQKAIAICSINIDVSPHLIAQQLLKIIGHDDIANLEKLRETLLIPNEDQLTEIINLIQSVNSNLLTPKFEVSETKTVVIRDQINLGIDPRIIAQEAREKGVLGPHSISCAEGASRISNNQLEAKNTNILEGTYAKNCGVCGAVIEAYITVGYVCKSCGEKFLGVC